MSGVIKISEGGQSPLFPLSSSTPSPPLSALEVGPF